jgi:hypothetical protein
LPQEIDDKRRQVLEALINTSLRLEVQNVGLPSNYEAVQRLLGKHVGPVDRLLLIDGKLWPAWWIIHAVLMKRILPHALQNSLAALSVNEQIEVIEDAVSGPYELHDMRQTGWPDYEAEKEYGSRFILLIADLLGALGQAGLDWAGSTAAAQLPLGERRNVIRSTVAAIVLARNAAASGQEPAPVIDQLVRLDQAPAGTYRQALREAFRHLPPERCIQLLAETALYKYAAYRDPRGEVRRWENEAGWDFLEFAPTDHAVTQIVAALREWERHQAAGDDPNATPVSGFNSHPYAHQPPSDEPFPRDRAIQILVHLGVAALPAIDAALVAGGIADRALFEEATRQIEGSG